MLCARRIAEDPTETSACGFVFSHLLVRSLTLGGVTIRQGSRGQRLFLAADNMVQAAPKTPPKAKALLVMWRVLSLFLPGASRRGRRGAAFLRCSFFGRCHHLRWRPKEHGPSVFSLAGGPGIIGARGHVLIWRTGAWLWRLAFYATPRNF